MFLFLPTKSIITEVYALDLFSLCSRKWARRPVGMELNCWEAYEVLRRAVRAKRVTVDRSRLCSL